MSNIDSLVDLVGKWYYTCGDLLARGIVSIIMFWVNLFSFLSNMLIGCILQLLQSLDYILGGWYAFLVLFIFIELCRILSRGKVQSIYQRHRYGILCIFAYLISLARQVSQSITALFMTKAGGSMLVSLIPMGTQALFARILHYLGKDPNFSIYHVRRMYQLERLYHTTDKVVVHDGCIIVPHKDGNRFVLLQQNSRKTLKFTSSWPTETQIVGTTRSGENINITPLGKTMPLLHFDQYHAYALPNNDNKFGTVWYQPTTWFNAFKFKEPNHLGTYKTLDDLLDSPDCLIF